VDKISGFRTRWSKATSFAVALAMAASACAHAQARTEPPRPALSPEPASVRIAPRNMAPTLSPASREALRKAFAAAAAGRWDEAQKLAAPHALGARVLLWTQLLRGALRLHPRLRKGAGARHHGHGHGEAGRPSPASADPGHLFHACYL